MNIEKQISDDHHAHLTVQVEADRLESMKRRAASQLAKRIKIPGFRPGKAPYPVIVRQVGEAAILEEAIELLVDDIYPDVIKEADIHPYAAGKLENINNAEPLTLEFSVPLEAETTLGDYHSIEKAYELGTVSEKEVEKVLQDLREHHAIIEPVERPAEVGDMVSIKMSATRLGEDGQSEVLIPERSSSVVIRPVQTFIQEEGEEKTDETPDEWPFPGFSQNLIGLASGEEKSLDYTYPEDTVYTTLKGATAQFIIQVEAVKSRQLPELDDEFGKTVGEYDTLEALKAEIRKSLEEQARTTYNNNYDEEILSAAIEQTEYKFPPEMVDHEIETVVDEFQRRLERQGMDMDLYLKTRNMDLGAFKEEVKPVAEGRIKRALFLVEFGKAEKIEVKPEELEKETFSTMDYLYNTLPERDSRKLSDRDVYTNIVGNVLADMLSHRSLDRFREITSGGLSKVEEEAEAAPQEVENISSEEDLDAEVADAGTALPSTLETDVTEDSSSSDSVA